MNKETVIKQLGLRQYDEYGDRRYETPGNLSIIMGDCIRIWADSELNAADIKALNYIVEHPEEFFEVEK